MKVNGKRRRIEDPAKLARWLGFLIDSRRWDGMTQTKVAQKAKMRPSNLSAFISSKGTYRNLSEQRLVESFNEAGIHIDGLLTAGLHRWDMLQLHAEDIRAFNEIIRCNPPSVSTTPARLLQLGEDQCYFLHRATPVSRVMAKIQRKHAAQIGRALDVPVELIGASAASELQSLWLTPHMWVVERAIDRYLGPEGAFH